MRNGSRWMLAIGLAAAVALASAPVIARPHGKLAVGAPAPDFELSLIDGTHLKLSDLRGQVVVLNYWATWCAPCKRELPLLDNYYRLQKSRDLRVFAITVEDSVPQKYMRQLFAAMAIPAVKSVKGDYGVMKGVPTNYIIDRSGRLRYAKAAAFDLDDLNRELVPLLQEPA